MNFPTTLWDLSLPTLPQQGQPGDEGDFLSILSKQIHGLPQPQPTLFNNVSPVVSDEASPSPPSAPKKGLNSATDSPASGQASGNTKRRPSDSQKRKASHDDVSDGDDDDDEDSHTNKASKEQHSQRSKRKSTGGDEGRLMKRKEQNRAAQRAFRERKEKHVKDLEDKVAALEQKSQLQASENENLRDLLSRLQNENLMLKQSAFTFSFPNGAGASPNAVRARSTSDSPANIPESAKSTSFPSLSSGSPKTLNSSSVDTSFTPLLSFGSVGNATSTSSASSLPPTASSSSFASPHPVPPVQSQWTTIASNPLYTSYTDMDSLNQYLQQNGFSLPVDSQPTAKQPQVQSTDALMDGLLQPSHDYESLIPFSSFTSPNPFQIRSPNSVSPVVHTAPASILPSQATSSASVPPSNPASIPRSQSPCGGAGPDEAPAAGSAAHHPDNAIMSIHKANSHVVDDGSQCPNSITEFQEIISKSEPSLFVPKDGVLDTNTMEFTEVLDHLRKLPCPDSNPSQEPEMDFLCTELTKKVRCSEAQASSFTVDEEAKVRAMLAKCAKKLQEEHASGSAADRLFNNPRRPSGSTSSNSSNATTILRTPAVEEHNLGNVPSSNLSSLALGGLDGMAFNFNPFLPMSYQQNLFDGTLESLGGSAGSKGPNQMDVELPATQGVTSPNTAFAQLFGTNIAGFSPSAYLSFDE